MPLLEDRRTRMQMADQIPAINGVYILWCGSDILYVGQARGVGGRVLDHSKMPFDRIPDHLCR